MYDGWDMGTPYPTIDEINGPRLFSLLDPHSLNAGRGEPTYSNASYALLGAVVERVAYENRVGSSFGDFVQRNLLAPNGLDEISRDAHAVFVADFDPVRLLDGLNDG